MKQLMLPAKIMENIKPRRLGRVIIENEVNHL